MDNELPGPPAAAGTAPRTGTDTTTDTPNPEPSSAEPPSTESATAQSATTESATTGPTQLRRSRDDRMLGGVCGGIAAALDVDATLLRIALVAATVLGFGAGVVIYLVCWLLIPEE